MKKIYLCGHTGSTNRGCEAIVRSTVKILRQCGVEDITLLTFNEADDRANNIDKIVALKEYPKKTLFDRGCSFLSKKLFKNGTWGARFYHKSFIKRLDSTKALLVNIGGDTYCYGTPHISYALNDLAEEYNIPNVFWGCSVEEDSYKDINAEDKLKVKSVHITVEAGFFKQKIDDLEIAIISPKIENAHTIEECVSIESVNRCDRWIRNIVESM